MNRRAAVYSSSIRRRRAEAVAPAAPQPAERSSPGELARAHPLKFRAAVMAAAFAILLAAGWALAPSPGGVTPEPPLEPAGRPSAADAYEQIRPSVVLVRGLPAEDEAEVEDEAAAEHEPEGNTGTGVVIVETGTILTNLHVVHGAKRVKVVFASGLEADADVVGVRPEHDLAVLQARAVPDDLVPATMRSTSDLRPGDEVVAVGFPFAIGPSASAGVISGLRREYRSPEGARVLTNLIQFDAAVNPGNSGGPLVTNEGEVIGIVTGLLNPTEQRVFIGIGFAVPIENAAAAAGLPPF
ncbi:MAG TPA: trypsin-like peptidase domain-containing protein [Burkholderiales bacterium]|nr:trypsin-like peptidase domain-containing protein [Burkholderiales bacterium]